MAACPVCGGAVTDGAAECPTCHLDVALFAPVRDAASLGRDADPVYYRTIAELFRAADLLGPAPELDLPEPAARSAPPPPTVSVPAPSTPLLPLPPVPDLPTGDGLRSRAHEYRLLGRQLGLEMPDLVRRAEAADEADDDRALAAVVREMFVHVASALVAAYDVEAARRQGLVGRADAPQADTELAGVRAAMDASDLTGAHRHLLRLREELVRLEEGWATQRILLTECDLLIETIRELGGDPAPALGPLEEGRRELDGPQRERAELLLAQTTYALWVLLEPKFTEELRRIRDRLVELRGSGADVAPALAKLRVVAAEIRRRNFAATVVAYRQLRDLVGRPGPSAAGAPAATAPESPPA